MKWSVPVQKKLDVLLTSKAKKTIAVFDGDGTLWHQDIGESFFKYQIKNSLAPGLKGVKNPWSHYKSLCRQNHEEAYGWLAQINSGTPEKALQKQAHDHYWKDFEPKSPGIIKKLIVDLQKSGFEIWVCSASIRWALEPALQDFNIPLDHLIAVEVRVQKGILTETLVEPLPYKSGKRLRLEQTLATQPLFVAGNSMGDLQMLEWAKEFPLVIIYKPHLPEIKESEEALMKEATKRKWPIQIFL